PSPLKNSRPAACRARRMLPIRYRKARAPDPPRGRMLAMRWRRRRCLGRGGRTLFGGDEAQLDAFDDGFGAVGHLELLEDAVEVVLDRLDAALEHRGDLLVRLAAAQER